MLPSTGVIFQLTLFVNTIGRALQLWLEFPGYSDPLPPAFFMIVARLSIAALGFSLSLYTYRSSWYWLWE